MSDPLDFLRGLPGRITAASTDALDLWERPLRVALIAIEERTKAAIAPKASTATDSPDEVLDVAEAASRCGMSETWLYKNAKKLPFTIRNGSSRLKFSARGIERWKARNTGVGR